MHTRTRSPQKFTMSNSAIKIDPIEITNDDASAPAKISPTSAASLPEEESRSVVGTAAGVNPPSVPQSVASLPDSNILANDVLLGRGGGTNRHTGNILFRDLVSEHQPAYVQARKRDKTLIAKSIVAHVRSKNGRFLREENGKWIDVGDKKAAEKASQALREGLSGRMRKIVKVGGAGIAKLKKIGFSIYEDNITRADVQRRIESFDQNNNSQHTHTSDLQNTFDEDDKKPSSKR